MYPPLIFFIDSEITYNDEHFATTALKLNENIKMFKFCN